jgi:hypothetical protein
VSREKVSFVVLNTDSQAPDRCRATNLLSFSTVVTTLRRSFSSVHREAPSTTQCRCSPVSYIYGCQHHTDVDPPAPLHHSSACIVVYHYPTLLFVDRSYRRRPPGERSWRAVTGRQLQRTIRISEPVLSVQLGTAYQEGGSRCNHPCALGSKADTAVPGAELWLPWCGCPMVQILVACRSPGGHVSAPRPGWRILPDAWGNPVRRGCLGEDLSTRAHSLYCAAALKSQGGEIPDENDVVAYTSP